MAIAHRDVAAILQKHGYKEVRKVGEGSFGKAILVQSTDGSKLICKMVDISKASARETQDALKEGKLLSNLKHPYVVRYRENFTDKGWFCILMDYCEGGDLTKQIEKAKRSRQPLQENQILTWLTQAMLGLKYIHDKHILHRDLKPSNFFLTNGTLQMGDFGIAKVLSSTLACARTQIGTPYYLSPEVCQEKPYSWASDIWAMGCILYEMCALKVPFDAPNISGLVQKITRGAIPSVPSNFSSFTRTLCSEMLNRNPNARPSPEDVLARPRIQSIVKELLGDALAVQGSDSEKAGVAAVEAGPLPAPVPPVISGPYKENAGNYKKQDLVDYNSTAHKDWLNATVVNVDGDGRIVIDLKPNTWISKEEQAVKVRPRRLAPAHIRACASPMRQNSAPRIGDQQRGASPSPMRQRSEPQVSASPMRQQSPRFAAGYKKIDYKKSDLVEYYSSTHKDWLPAIVINVDMEGKIVIDLKPNTWICKEEQASKIRRRVKSVQDPLPPRPVGYGAGAASPLRHRSGSRQGTPRQSPSREASPAPRAGTPWRNRGNTPSRAASPCGGAPAAANGTPRRVSDSPGPRPGIPRVDSSPGMRRRSAVGAAGFAIAGA